MAAGEEGGHGAGVVAAAVAQRVGLLVRQAAVTSVKSLWNRLSGSRITGRSEFWPKALASSPPCSCLAGHRRTPGAWESPAARLPSHRPGPFEGSIADGSWPPAAAGQRRSPGREEKSGGAGDCSIHNWTNLYLFGGQRIAVARCIWKGRTADHFQHEGAKTAGRPSALDHFVDVAAQS